MFSKLFLISQNIFLHKVKKRTKQKTTTKWIKDFGLNKIQQSWDFDIFIMAMRYCNKNFFQNFVFITQNICWHEMKKKKKITSILKGKQIQDWCLWLNPQFYHVIFDTCWCFYCPIFLKPQLMVTHCDSWWPMVTTICSLDGQ